ncbi:MAG: cupin domain-containing protein, partial [Bradyrhizobiaceae bacterium]|nr:cupin domain-containing protein [Bradyrhizobiaceae bacterium]
MSQKIQSRRSRFADLWRPKVIAAHQRQEIKIVKMKGTFPWHFHEAEDEFFSVWRGRFRVEWRERIIDLGPGEGVVVPRCVEHRAAAEDEADTILFEPAATRNT